MPSVFPHWMAELPMQQQSVLVLALRGPDGIRKHHPCKDVVRAYRGSVLMAAKFGRSLDFGEAADTFMSMDKIAVPPDWEAAMRAFFEHIDELPHHYIAHLMHGAHILACHHPSQALKDRWRWFYRLAVDDAHLIPEPDDVMNERLGDWGRRHWDGATSSPPPAPLTPPRATGAATREDAGRGSGGALRCVRHKRRGSTYEVLGEAEAQVSTNEYGRPIGLGLVRRRYLVEGNKLTVYRDPRDGRLFVRFPDEFEDGRFEEVEHG